MNQKEIDTEVDRLQEVLGTRYYGFKTWTTQKVAKALLLRGWYLMNGKGCNPVAKSVGCGVYDVWLEGEKT